MLKFQRLSKLSSEGDVILKALQKSEEKLIEVDLENKKVRRNPEIPLPEVEDDEAKKLKTIYLKGFEKTNTTLDDLLGFFNKYEGVVHVTRRTYVDRKDDSRQFKGSVFVLFKVNAYKLCTLNIIDNYPMQLPIIYVWLVYYIFWIALIF